MVDTTRLKNEASEWDHFFGAELKNADLFFELNFDDKSIHQAQELFGRAVDMQMRTGAKYSEIIKKYPALTLVSLIGAAGVSYEHGTYWDGFWEAVVLEGNQAFASALRHSLGMLIRRFDLRQFPEFLDESKYVGVLALHAGIPVHCLSDLIDVIAEHVHSGRDANAAALLEWLTAPGMEYRMNQLDVPVRNFLRYAGGVAVDILDRIIEFVMFTVDNPDWSSEFTLGTSTTGLPTLVLEGIIDRLRERPFGQAAEAVDRRPARRRPVIGYSVADDQVMVGVPYPRENPDEPWTVSFAGTTRRVYAEPGWGVAEGEEHPPTFVAINAPAREVILIHGGSGEEYPVPVVDTSDPLLLFTGEGRLIGRHAALPRGTVLVLLPKDASLVDAETKRTVETVGEERVPAGWNGWRSQYVDLGSHSSVLVRRPGRADGAVRGVRSQGSPRIEHADGLPGLTTPNGLPVYGERPEVVLPPHIGDTPVSWRVRVRKADDRTLVCEDTWDSADEEAYLDPFDGQPYGLLGRYEIRVTEAGGRSIGGDLRYTSFLAEGIEIEHGDAFRAPVSGGLTPSEAVVACTGPLEADRELVCLETYEQQADIRVSRGATAFKLVLRPPAFQSRVDPVGQPAQWRTSPSVIAPAQLAEHAVAAVRVPGDVAVSVALADQNGAIVQEEQPDTPVDNVFQLPTRKFADTAQRLGGCTLTALIDDSTGASHSIAVAHIRPAKLCEAVEVDGGTLKFRGLADEDDLAAWVWAATAPWRPAEQVPIIGDSAALPPSLRQAGDLIVQVFKDDPWQAAVTRPGRPGPAAIRVAELGWVRDPNDAWDGLSRFFSGRIDTPLQAECIPGAWSALDVLTSDRWDSESERVRVKLITLICRNPRSALEALGHSTIAYADKMALLVETHLIECAYSASFTLNELHPDPWVGCMVEISDLPALSEKKDRARREREETIGYLRNQGGEELIHLLTDGTMEAPRAGVFSRDDLAVDGVPDEQVHGIFEEFRLVPGAVLDIDTRTSATADAFLRRSEWAHEDACAELPGHVSKALHEIKSVAPPAYDAITVRREALEGIDTEDYPWTLLSVQSLTLAVTARLWARGELERSPLTRDARAAWVRMTDYFPALVAGDLLIADALAAYVSHGNLIGAAE